MLSCQKCRSADLVRVRMTFVDVPVLFLHCRSCEHRWWVEEQTSAPIDLSDVLGRVSR